MDEPRHLLFPLRIKLLCIEAKRAVTQGVEAIFFVRLCYTAKFHVSQSFFWRSIRPLLKRLVEPVNVGALLDRVIKFQAIRPTIVLRFKMSVSQKSSEKNLFLKVGQLERALFLFDLLAMHRVDP